MENDHNYNLEDLLRNESFRNWATGQPGEHVLFWENWLTQNPDKKDLAEEALVIIKGLPFEFREKSADPNLVRKEWEKLSARTRLIEVRSSKSESQKRQLPSRSGIRILRIAASITILTVFAFLLHQYILNPLIEYRTRYGQQLSIVLPDSTTVNLNANSILTHRKWNPRKIWLDGEAFFRVKRKPASGAHFQVITNDLTVEVLGTAFNVIEKEDKTEVILEEGSVKLNLNRDFNEELYMQPGELIGFSAKATQKVEKRQVKTQSLTSWKDGVLKFDDVMLSELMDRIAVIYGWQARYDDDELQGRKITIGLPSDDLETALVMLRKAIGIEIEKVPEEKKLLLH